MRKIFFSFVCLLWTLTAFGQGSARITTIALPSKYPLVGAPVQLKATVQNTGTNAITSFKLNYSINGGNTISAPASISIGAGSIKTVDHTGFWTPAVPANHSIKMWVTDINSAGGTNAASNNGEATTTVASATQLADKHVLIEYYSGEWCGWCPDGAVAIQAVKNEFEGRVIASTIHEGDFMENASGNAMISAFGITGFPSGTVDRKSPAGGGSEVLNRGEFRDAVAAQLTNSQVPIGIDIEQTYNCNTRQILIKVNADFYAPFSEKSRIMFFVQEDGVTGQAQRNFTNNTAGHPYQGLGDPIPNYSHKDVYRGTNGSVYGQAIAQNIEAGKRYSQLFTFNVPATGVDLNKLYIVAAVVKDGTARGQREVFNVRRVKLDATKHMLSFFDKGDSYVNKTVTIPFTTAGCPTDPTVTVSSSNNAVLSASNLVLSGTGLNRTLTINTGTTTGITNLTITSVSGATTVSRTFQYIVQDQTTSVESADIFAGVSVYPNPSTRFVEVDLGGLNGQKVQFEVLDLNGKAQKIASPAIQENKATLDLRGLKAGMYLLEISNEKGKAMRKIIKE